ncbi:MAG: DUF3566 domain-containing protein [Actinomycetia bacterium]|nr:DUF3566 domain-containing protein [Actinomycetes bacterium]
MSTTDDRQGPQRPGSSSSGSSSSGSAGSGSSGSGSSGNSANETKPIARSESGSAGSSPRTATKTAERQQRPDGQGQRPAATKTAAKKGAPGRPGGPGGRPGAAAKKVAQPRVSSPRPAGRRVRLTVSRIDPWSAMKISLLLSVAIGIAMVVMVVVLWWVLAGMGVFDAVNNIAADIIGADGADAFDLMQYIGLGRVASLAIVIAVIDVILITAIATLGAFLYNVSAALVGGLQLTLTDD